MYVDKNNKELNEYNLINEYEGYLSEKINEYKEKSPSIKEKLL